MSYNSNKTPVVKNHGVWISYDTLRMCAITYHHYEAQLAVESFLRHRACFSPKWMVRILYTALTDNYTIFMEDESWRPKVPETSFQ